MKAYLELLRQVLDTGIDRGDRTGTGTRSVFGTQLRLNLGEGFPLLTTKRMHLRSIICELLWFLRGQTNIRYLHEQGVTIWDEWADSDGELGPIYGRQWRAWDDGRGHLTDQIAVALDLIRRDPDSRRILVSAWNVGELPDMALPPCHVLFQFYVAAGRLSCLVYQRSCDMFLGVPFNLASYALLTMLMARAGGLAAGDLIWTGGDTHLYHNHFEQARTQLSRSPRPLPQLRLRRTAEHIWDYEYEDFELVGYDPHPPIRAEVAV